MPHTASLILTLGGSLGKMIQYSVTAISSAHVTVKVTTEWSGCHYKHNQDSYQSASQPSYAAKISLSYSDVMIMILP